jgi:chondroitin AC lyase
MHHCRLVAVLAAVILSGVAHAASAAVDVARLSDAVRQATIDDALGTTPDGRRAKVADAVAIAGTLSPDGTWPDVDYANASRGAWPSAKHCERVVLMAAAATEPGPHGDQLTAAAVRAIGWWRAKDPKCLNWWYNEIAIPRFLGRAAIVLRDRLPRADRDYITGTVLPRAERQKMTGTNTVSLSGNVLLRGLLQGDPRLVESSLATVFGRATVTTSEGIQPDFSFHQHGPQQQFGNYGQELFAMLTDLDNTVEPAGWRMSDEQRSALRRFALDGLQWTLWRGVMDVSACGRQLFPNSGEGKAKGIAAAIGQFAKLSPGDRAACDAVARRAAVDAPNDLVGDRYYWRSDYAVHRRPGFMASLRMASTRVIGGESLNGENLAGYHLGDGATFFYRSGREYQDALPLYDWRKIPGVTSPWSTGPMPKFSTIKGGSDFVGGATDGTDGVVAFNLRRDGVSADKAFFFLGDNVVCLGATITAKGSDPIVTTIDQFQLPADAPDFVRTATSFQDHGLRYELLSPGDMTVSRQQRTGQWSTLFRNGATPKGTVRGTIVTLWIDHGRQPTDASYAYRICPAESPKPVNVLSNTSALQAVEAVGKVAAVLRAAGSVVVDGKLLHVDQPCTLLADPADHTVTLADPTQKLTSIRVTWGGASSVTTLPTNGMAGSSVKVVVARS